MELAVYRIVQEALTNVVRHAGSADCRVNLSRVGPEAVEIEVVNDAPPRLPSRRPGSGHGLIGMRERAAMCGGTLSAGPLPTGGFRVHARLRCGSETAW